MKLYLTKPDLMYYQSYNEMMHEWTASGTRIAPWFLDDPIESLDAFAAFIRMLDDCEHGRTDSRYCATTSYFAMDGDRLIGAASLRHYLTMGGLQTFGHIGYGVRPSERGRGYATAILHLMLDEARQHKIHRVLLGAHTSNTASCRVIEKCGGILVTTK